VIVPVLLTWLLLLSWLATPPDATPRPAAAGDRLAAIATRDGRVRVIVALRTPFTAEAKLGADARTAQHTRIADTRSQALAALRGADHSVVHTYRTVPLVAMRLSPKALAALRKSGEVAAIFEDKAFSPALAESTQIVEARESAAPRIGRRGAGQTIAVLETGIDKDHPMLQQAPGGPSKVVAEACFSAGSDCPNGSTEQIGPGAGVHCTWAPFLCAHGTSVAGVAAGNDFAYTVGGAPYSGVAPDANLISVRTASMFTGTDCAGQPEDPCAKSFISDVLAGLEWVYDQRTNFTLAAANLSLGHDFFTSDCDAAVPFWKTLIDNLRSVGIATVVASGNDGSNTAIKAPACVSTAVAVGATDDSDAVAGFSNSSSSVDLLAPGVDLLMPSPNASFLTWFGTSYATPHVAGAFAILKQIDPAASVTTMLSALQTTGKPVTDPDNSVTKPRIRVLSAGTRLKDTGFRDVFHFRATGADVASNGVGLTTRAGGPSSGNITISGVPSGAFVGLGLLYWQTVGGPDDTAVFQGISRTGELIGVAREGCWNVNQLGPYRTYRAVIPLEDVPGNGSYSVSGVGSPPASQGQGASLVLVYSRAGERTSWVHLRDGAMSLAFLGEKMTNRFGSLTIPPRVTHANLHLGIADGYAANPENPLRFAREDITAANAFAGSDGVAWDDFNLTLNPSLVAGRTIENTLSLPAASGNCLAWPYAALAYG
jgi:subtilisin family serine protease